MEEALFETPLTATSLLTRGSERIPDRVSILRFSNLLEEHQFSIHLFTTVVCCQRAAAQERHSHRRHFDFCTEFDQGQ